MVVFLGLACCANAQRMNVDSLRKVPVPVAVRDTLRPYDTTLRVDTTLIETPKLPHKIIPKKATIFALAAPGGGQIYNRDYWKLPIVYGAFGAAIYTIHWNSLRYNDFLKPYLTSVDPNTGLATGKSEYEVYVRGKDEIRTLSLDQVKRGKTFYRRYREYGYVILAAVYALSVVEANVAAHLKTFDMTEDLTFRLEPSVEQTFMNQSSTGLKLVFAFK